jgi:hypothetical protein
VKRKPYLEVSSNEMYAGPGRPTQRKRAPISATVYFLIAGIVSLMVGAGVSLAASGTGRLVLWSGATATTAVAAGIAYESRLLRIAVQVFSRSTGRRSTS